MKARLSIKTPSAGIVRVLPDCSEANGCVMLQYLCEVSTAQRTAAAHYLFEEGFSSRWIRRGRSGAHHGGESSVIVSDKGIVERYGFP